MGRGGAVFSDRPDLIEPVRAVRRRFDLCRRQSIHITPSKAGRFEAGRGLARVLELTA